MVFQEPMTALNPLHTIGHQIGEMLRVNTRLTRRAVADTVLALLREVHLPDPEAALKAFPHDLSAGHRKPALIAMALSLEPHVTIADPTPTTLPLTPTTQTLKTN